MLDAGWPESTDKSVNGGACAAHILPRRRVTNDGHGMLAPVGVNLSSGRGSR